MFEAVLIVMLETGEHRYNQPSMAMCNMVKESVVKNISEIRHMHWIKVPGVVVARCKKVKKIV